MYFGFYLIHKIQYGYPGETLILTNFHFSSWSRKFFQLSYIILLRNISEIHRCFIVKKNKLLTDGRHKRVTSLVAPARRMEIGTIVIDPVIIVIGPAIKMDLKSIRLNFHDGRDADEYRIAFIDNFQLHSNLETVRRTLHWETKTIHTWWKMKNLFFIKSNVMQYHEWYKRKRGTVSKQLTYRGTMSNQSRYRWIILK